MPKRKTDALDVRFARDILAELQQYAIDNQFYPGQNALFVYMTTEIRDKETGVVIKPAYDITIGEFNWWYARLVEDGYIKIDRQTRAVRSINLTIVERDAMP